MNTTPSAGAATDGPDLSVESGETVRLSPDSKHFTTAYKRVYPTDIDDVRALVGLPEASTKALSAQKCCGAQSIPAGLASPNDLTASDQATSRRAKELAVQAAYQYVTSSNPAALAQWKPLVNDGQPGSRGTDGQNGSNGSNVTIQVSDFVVGVNIDTSGGLGGGGGAGGAGGVGGAGGAAGVEQGDIGDHPAHNAYGGNGAPGGDGGLGGRGGDGGNITIVANTITTGTVHAQSEGGAGGLGGAAGIGGSPGAPGGEVHALNPNGNPPLPGPNGHTGMSGVRGIDGSIDIVQHA